MGADTTTLEMAILATRADLASSVKAVDLALHCISASEEGSQQEIPNTEIDGEIAGFGNSSLPQRTGNWPDEILDFHRNK